MAFENELPVGSVPFSNQLYKDTNDRVWTGNPFDSEFYRFLDRSEVEFIYINVKDFGAVGDGVTDDTEAFESALAEAKSTNNYLYFPDGVYPITVSDDTIDMNGCLGLQGKGELLFTSTGNPDAPLLKWEGEKQRIASNISVSELQNEFTVDTGLSINKGDTVFLVSDELVGTVTVRYVKGFRFTVDEYSPSTGAIKFYEYCYFGITDGFFYLNTVRPRVLIQDVKITLTGNLDKKGVEVNAGEIFVNNLNMDGFGRFGVNVSSSMSRIQNSEIKAALIESTTSGYALQCSGLSDIVVNACNLYGARHGIACGDVGYWRSGDVDDPGADAAIRLPPIVRVSGCRVEGTSYAVDSHAGTILLDLYNCDIYGGAILGGIEMYINASRIYEGKNAGNYGIRLGRDRPIGGGIPQSRYGIRDTVIYTQEQLITIYADIKHIELTNVTVIAGPKTSTRNMIAYSSGVVIENWVVRGLRHEGNVGDNSLYEIRMQDSFFMDGVALKYAGINLAIQGPTANALQVVNSDIYNPNGYGIRTGALMPANRQYDLVVASSIIRACQSGLTITRARGVTLSGVLLTDNNNGINFENNASGTVFSAISSCTFNQSSGNFITQTNNQPVELTLIGNVFSGEGEINIDGSQIVGKYGNIGLDDKLKTSLTTATTEKYGADGTTGDLTLS